MHLVYYDTCGAICNIYLVYTSSLSITGTRETAAVGVVVKGPTGDVESKAALVL